MPPSSGNDGPGTGLGVAEWLGMQRRRSPRSSRATSRRSCRNGSYFRKKPSLLQTGRITEAELLSQSRNFLHLLRDGLAKGGGDVSNPAYAPARELLAELSRSRALQGFSPSETAKFIFSLKQPLFGALSGDKTLSPTQQAQSIWAVTLLLDELGLYTTEVFQKSREDVIARQQQEMLELSTPVVKLWDGVLALPLIGTLDSARTQVVMESLLQTIVDTGAEIAIIDITGVPTVDTLVAQHLLKTVAAARLMGADCIISGIRPQIAQTIVHLGVDLSEVITKATLADAFAVALQRTGRAVATSAGADGRHARRVGRGEPMDRIPILKMGECLLVTIQVDMHDQLAMRCRTTSPSASSTIGAHGVLIDISALDIVDSFIGRMLGNIAAMSRVLDARDGRRRHAAGGRDHAGRARAVAAGRADGAERRARHGRCCRRRASMQAPRHEDMTPVDGMSACRCARQEDIVRRAPGRPRAGGRRWASASSTRRRSSPRRASSPATRSITAAAARVRSSR